MRIGSLASEAWKARAAPRKPVWIEGGRLISRAAPLMASTASPREAPGARVNEMVTAGGAALGGGRRGVSGAPLGVLRVCGLGGCERPVGGWRARRTRVGVTSTQSNRHAW